MTNNTRRRHKLSLRSLLISAVLIVVSIVVIVACTSKESNADKGSEVVEQTTITDVVTTTAATTTTEPEAPTVIEITETFTESTQVTEPQWIPDNESVEALAKTLWGECRGVKSLTRQAAVAWCVLNRVDDSRFGNTVLEVVSAYKQFTGYKDTYPVTEELRELAIDVLTRWHLEHEGFEDVGRVIPKTYVYFHGDGKENHFFEVWKVHEYWDWSLESPYES